MCKTRAPADDHSQQQAPDEQAQDEQPRKKSSIPVDLSEQPQDRITYYQAAFNIMKSKFIFRSAAVVVVALCTSQILVSSIQNDLAGISNRFLSADGGKDVGIGDEYDDKKFEISNWEYMGTNKHVATYSAKVVGTPLLAFRGLALYDMHISDVTGPFVNPERAYEWIDMLEKIEEFDWDPSQLVNKTKQFNEPKQPSRGRRLQDAFTAPNKNVSVHMERDIVYEVFKLPFPIKSRDILLRRDWNYTTNNEPSSINHIGGALTINYKSIDDKRVPFTKKFIRSISPYTQWKFVSLKQSLADEPGSLLEALKAYEIPDLEKVYKGLIVNPSYKGPQTLVAIECLVDSKGSVPTWFINFIQRSWPSKSLAAFREMLSKKKDPPFPKVKGW
jgi:hypothetical protein